MKDKNFTGECFVPGKAPKRLEQDHLARYAFAAQYVVGKRVLDIACGSGYGSRSLYDDGAASVDGVDLSADVVAFANEHFACPGVTYHSDSIYTFHADAPYDVIISFETIEHVDDHRRALANLYRLLADDGTLIISSPNRFVTSPEAVQLSDKPRNPYHVLEFVRDEFVAALTDSGFQVAEGNLFGQRLQPRIESLFLRKLYKQLFRPQVRKSADVEPLDEHEPRYFVAVATKTA